MALGSVSLIEYGRSDEVLLVTLGYERHWLGDFPGSPVVKILCFHCRGVSSIPSWGTKIAHAILVQPK